MLMNFRVTPAAAGEILAAAERSGAQGMALRVAARPVQGGIDYGMGFDDPAPDDDVGVVAGLTVLVGGPSRDLLAGTVLDFVEIEPGRHDFIFVPPVAASGCGVAQPGPVSTGGCGSGGCAGCSR
jgi:iron-sulfur cluster assembly protein